MKKNKNDLSRKEFIEYLVLSTAGIYFSSWILPNCVKAMSFQKQSEPRILPANIPVEKMTYYGKGATFSDESDPNYKLFKKLYTKSINQVFWDELGLLDTIRTYIKLGSETRAARKGQIGNVKFDQKIMDAIQPFIAIMKILTEKFGNRRAEDLFRKIFATMDNKLTTEQHPLNVIMFPIAELQSCDDPFTSFKKYLSASLNVTKIEGCLEFDVIKNTKDTFYFNMDYCAAYEMAKAYGNPDYCFPWCEVDEVGLPKTGMEIGFKYKRTQTMAQGASHCDFKFDRIKTA